VKIYNSAFESGRWAPGAVAAVGKFDGIHLGHQKIIRLAVARAKKLKVRCLVVTFDPLPDQFLLLYSYRPLLSEAEKMEILGRMGVDAVVIMPFDKELACLSPEAFAVTVLKEQLKAREIVVGEDFCFGKDRAGTAEALIEFGRAMGFKVHAVPLVRAAGQKISASRIRELIESGNRAGAEKLLGRAPA